MPQDAPTATRDPVRTRRAILDAAVRLVLADGSTVSLETVARTAGVSKGGLLHHFPNKDALFVAIAEDLLERFAGEVEAQVDPDDRGPGRLVRAYVRAIFAELGVSDTARRDASLMASLGVIPEVVRRGQEDGRRWRAAIAADGLDPDRAAVIIRAAEGTSAASLYEGRLDPEELVRMRDLLLDLSREPGRLTGGGG